MDEYTNNLHARIDNILTDAYFGAGANVGASVPSPYQSVQVSRKMNNSESILTCVIWLIIGVVIGVFICYISFFNEGDSNTNDETQ